MFLRSANDCQILLWNVNSLHNCFFGRIAKPLRWRTRRLLRSGSGRGREGVGVGGGVGGLNRPASLFLTNRYTHFLAPTNTRFTRFTHPLHKPPHSHSPTPLTTTFAFSTTPTFHQHTKRTKKLIDPPFGTIPGSPFGTRLDYSLLLACFMTRFIISMFLMYWVGLRYLMYLMYWIVLGCTCCTGST